MRFLIMFFGAVGLLTSPATAQIDDILDDIFGKRSGNTYPYPGGQYPGFGTIENIPVEIDISTQRNLDDHILIVSAYAPPVPNVRESRPRLLGQTRILLNGLGNQMNLVVAAPDTITRDIPEARLSAEIIDANDQTVMISRQDAYYRGRQPAALELIASGLAGSNPPPPISGTVETVRGDVNIASQNNQLFRGGTLVVELVEDGLAGGPGAQTVLGQTRIDIDQKSPPFAFELDHVRSGGSNAPVNLRAYIEDWAGRRVMESATPTSYRGAGSNYKLMLSPYSGTSVVTGHPATRNNRVEGEAQFDAFKGLPSGSRLEITIMRDYGTPSQDRVIAKDVIQLDGRSGYIRFDANTPAILFETGRPDPIIKAEILDDRDRVFFTSSDQTLARGFNTIRLSPTSVY